MRLLKNQFYQKFVLKLISKDNLKNKEFVEKVSILLFLWVFTTIIMWLYFIFCLHAFPSGNPVPWGGLIFTILHTLAPLILYFTQSISTTSLSISLTGLCFQTLFCIYNEGIYSPAAIWLALHPVILGFFGSTVLIIYSVSLNFIIFSGLFLLGHFQLLPLDTLSPSFKFYMVLTSYIGLDFLVAIFTIGSIQLFKKINNEIRTNKEQKENLLHILCHDLSNTIQIIMSSAQKAKKAPTREDGSYEKILGKIFMASNLQKELINHVRKMEMIQSGKQPMILDLIDVSEVLNLSKEIFTDRCIEKNINLDIQIDSIDNTLIVAEKISLLNNVFNNLISNALKFSNPGDKIFIKVKTLGDKVIIEIQDQGIGMPELIRQNLFSKNAPTTRNGTLGEKGTGFGMVLLKTCMDSFKAQVEVLSLPIESNPVDHGTLVRLTFANKL